jgi:hypothetical protein
MMISFKAYVMNVNAFRVTYETQEGMILLLIDWKSNNFSLRPSERNIALFFTFAGDQKQFDIISDCAFDVWRDRPRSGE